MTLNDFPGLIFKLLLLAVCIRANPGLGFEKGHEHARNIIVLHHLVNDWQRQCLQLIRNEANQAETGHSALEIHIFELLVHLLLLCLAQDSFCALRLCIWLDELVVGEGFALAHHVGKLSIAVVDQLD